MLNAHSGTTNNYGHIAPIDFQPGSHPLLVVGDSFIESLMNDFDDTLQGLLGKRLGPAYPVYGLGGSGLSVSDYAVLASQARVEFAPAAIVFLIQDGDISESLLHRHGGYFLSKSGASFVPSYVPLTPNSVLQWARRHGVESALYLYLRSNLKFSPGDLFGAFEPGNRVDSHRPARELLTDRERAVADWFLGAIAQGSGVPSRCTLLLIDADRYAIYDAQLASPPKDSAVLRAHLIDRARALGYRVVDMEPIFRAEYARTRLKFDYWPIDRHWNRAGHALAAEVVMAELFGHGDRTCMPGRSATGS
jgi:hypothetical protein